MELVGHNRDAFTLSAEIGEHHEYIEDIAVVKHSEYLKGNSAVNRVISLHRFTVSDNMESCEYWASISK